MNRYELGEAGLVPCGTVFEESADAADLVVMNRRRRRTAARRRHRATSTRSWTWARARLQRVSPEQAHEALAAGSVLVDIRPAQRLHEGEDSRAILVERNVLEWR